MWPVGGVEGVERFGTDGKQILFVLPCVGWQRHRCTMIRAKDRIRIERSANRDGARQRCPYRWPGEGFAFFEACHDSRVGFARRDGVRDVLAQDRPWADLHKDLTSRFSARCDGCIETHGLADVIPPICRAELSALDAFTG